MTFPKPEDLRLQERLVQLSQTLGNAGAKMKPYDSPSCRLKRLAIPHGL